MWSRYTDDVDTARAALRRSIARARDTGDDLRWLTFLCLPGGDRGAGGDYAAAAAALAEADQAAAWHDWPPSPWHLEPRCELLIAAGDLDEAVSLADECLPDEEARPVTSASWARAYAAR